MPEESRIYFGDTLKTLDADGKVGGYLIRFTDAANKDLDGEFFTEKTYLGSKEGDGVDAYFHHGKKLRLPDSVGDEVKSEVEALSEYVFSPIKTTRDAIGIFAEVVLDMSKKYEEAVYGLVKKGKLGWSSGAVDHLVRVDSNGEIKRWPIGEASLTPTPAEPLNRAIAVKSLNTLKFVGLFNPSNKSMLAEEMAQTTPSTWEVQSAFARVIRKIAETAKNGDVTGLEFDWKAKATLACSELGSEMTPLVISQIQEYLDSTDDEFYLKSTVSESLESFDDVVAALEKQTHNMQRNHDNRVKEGRVLSSSNRSKVQAAYDALGVLLAESEPKPKEEKGIDVVALRTQSLRVRNEAMSTLAQL